MKWSLPSKTPSTRSVNARDQIYSTGCSYSCIEERKASGLQAWPKVRTFTDAPHRLLSLSSEHAKALEVEVDRHGKYAYARHSPPQPNRPGRYWPWRFRDLGTTLIMPTLLTTSLPFHHIYAFRSRPIAYWMEFEQMIIWDRRPARTIFLTVPHRWNVSIPIGIHLQRARLSRCNSLISFCTCVDE